MRRCQKLTHCIILNPFSIGESEHLERPLSIIRRGCIFLIGPSAFWEAKSHQNVTQYMAWQLEGAQAMVNMPKLGGAQAKVNASNPDAQYGLAAKRPWQPNGTQSAGFLHWQIHTQSHTPLSNFGRLWRQGHNLVVHAFSACTIHPVQ